MRKSERVHKHFLLAIFRKSEGAPPSSPPPVTTEDAGGVAQDSDAAGEGGVAKDGGVDVGGATEERSLHLTAQLEGVEVTVCDSYGDLLETKLTGIAVWP